MRKLMLVVRKEYLERVRSRAFVLATILGPIGMFILMVGPALLAQRSGYGERRVVVIDQTGAGLTARLQAELTKMHEPAPRAEGADAGAHGANGASGASEVDGADGANQAPPAGAANPRRAARNRRATGSKVTLENYAGATEDLDAARAALNPRVKGGELDGYLVLPADFLQSGRASYYGEDLSSVVWTDLLEEGLSKLYTRERLSELGLDEERLAQITRGANLKTYEASGGKGSQSRMEGRLIAAIVMIVLLYMMILMYGQTALHAVVEDKTSRVVEVMLGSVTPAQLMMGKLIGGGLVGVTQFGIWGVLFLGLAGQATRFLPNNFDLSFLTPMLWAFFAIYFLLGYVLFASLYAAVGAMCNTVQESQQLLWPITIFVIIPMVLLQPVMQAPDSTQNVVLSLFPFFTPILMFIRIALGRPPAWQIFTSIVLLTLTVLFMARVAGKMFRLGILSFGKAPTWPQIMKLLRSAD